MLAAKIQGAEAVFVPQPFDDEQGVMSIDGSPGELLVLPGAGSATAIVLESIAK